MLNINVSKSVAENVPVPENVKVEGDFYIRSRLDYPVTITLNRDLDNDGNKDQLRLDPKGKVGVFKSGEVDLSSLPKGVKAIPAVQFR